MTPDEVGREVERFDGAAAVVLRRLVESIAGEVTGPLKEAASVAAREHAGLSEAAEAWRAEPGSDDRERAWRLVRRIGRSADERVLTPLRTRLGEIDVGKRLAECLAEARRGLTDAAAAAPLEVTRPEPEDTYRRHEGDNVAWRAGKWFVRAGRWIRTAGRSAGDVGRRLLGKPRSPSPDRVQVLPVRTLLEYHATSRMAGQVDEALEVVRQRLAQHLGDCERSVGAWADSMLETDAALDRACHHVSRGVGVMDDSSPHPCGEDDQESEPLDHTLHTAAEERARSRLGLAIAALSSSDPLTGLEERLVTAVAAVRPRLLRDLRQVGTFMLDPERRAAPERPTRVARDAAAREAHWTAWYRQVVARMELVGHLGRVRGGLLGILDAFDSDMETVAAAPVRAMLQRARQTVTTVLRDVESLVLSAREAGDATELRAGLEAARDTATSALETHVLTPMRSGEIDGSMRERADGRVGELIALIESLPEILVVHQPAAEPEAVEPDAKAIEIRLRPMAEQAYDAVVLERFRVAPDSLAAALARVRDETHQLGSVIRFNVDSALDELATHSEAPGEAVDAAKELALNGLDRTLATLDEVQGVIVRELPRVRRRLFDAHARGWRQFHDRVGVEDRMQEQILDFRYRLRSELRERLSAVSAMVRRATRWSMRWLRLGRGRAMRLVRLGQSALEGERVTEVQKRRTIDALSTLDDVLGNLPLVYRRLFSFQPVSDPGMLEGRASDIDALTTHFAHWREGSTDAFVVTGYDGNGRTSFVNVVAATVLRDTDVRRVRLTERILDEPTVAGRLARELGVDDGGSWALDRLALALSSRPRDEGRPLVCIIENLEHLFLRTSADNGLVGPFLAFMSRVDASVFWLATLSEPAWTYIEKVESATACLVRRHALGALDRDTLEAVIMQRHQRSGLRVEFQPPTVASSILRRRLGRARDDAERQAILRAEYFDQVSRLTGQNLLLAIFYWVRSVQLDPDTSTMRVRALEPVSFAYIDAFTLSQSFTLKAFLDHATLSLAEHDRIFRMSRDESHHIFESLGNLLVIEPAHTAERVTQFVFTTIDDEQRYRIRPLVVHPVLTHLRSKNIVT